MIPFMEHVSGTTTLREFADLLADHVEKALAEHSDRLAALERENLRQEICSVYGHGLSHLADRIAEKMADGWLLHSAVQMPSEYNSGCVQIMYRWVPA